VKFSLLLYSVWPNASSLWMWDELRC